MPDFVLVACFIVAAICALVHLLIVGWIGFAKLGMILEQRRAVAREREENTNAAHC